MRRASRTRIAAGVVGMALVLALAGCSGQTSKAAGATSTTPTTSLPPAGTATATPWPSGPGSWHTLSDCQSAPASYRTMYAAGVNPPEQGAATTVTLQRSDDCGATWKALTPPKATGVVYNTNVWILSIFASPLNPRIAILTAQVTMVVGGTPACSSTYTAAPASGIICQLQFVTSDSGATWQPLTLPVRGVLGQISPEANAFLTLLGPVRPQGSRLYGVVTNAVMGSNATIPPGRLVASDDSGLTWKLADAALAAQGLGIWDFAPTPSGSAIYVTAEPFNDPARQPPNYGATLSIWSSPDGGATWTRESKAPGSTSGILVSGMVAGRAPNGKRFVYLMISQKNMMSIVGSLNDGATWQGDGHLSYTTPSGGMMGAPTFIGTLPDGSVVAINPYDGTPITAWMPGSPPRAVAEETSLFPYWDPIFQQQGSDVYMWLQGDQGGPIMHIHYTQLLL